MGNMYLNIMHFGYREMHKRLLLHVLVSLFIVLRTSAALHSDVSVRVESQLPGIKHCYHPPLDGNLDWAKQHFQVLQAIFTLYGTDKLMDEESYNIYTLPPIIHIPIADADF